MYVCVCVYVCMRVYVYVVVYVSLSECIRRIYQNINTNFFTKPRTPSYTGLH